MTTALLYALLCGAGYYLLARALITRWLWSRYPAWLDKVMMCASCTGFWLGLGCGALGWWLDLSLLGLRPDHYASVVAAGLCGIVWTPLVVYPVLVVLEALQGDPLAGDAEVAVSPADLQPGGPKPGLPAGVPPPPR